MQKSARTALICFTTSLNRQGPVTLAAKDVVWRPVLLGHEVSCGVVFAALIEVPERLPPLLTVCLFDASSVITLCHD